MRVWGGVARLAAAAGAGLQRATVCRSDQRGRSMDRAVWCVAVFCCTYSASERRVRVFWRRAVSSLRVPMADRRRRDPTPLPLQPRRRASDCCTGRRLGTLPADSEGSSSRRRPVSTQRLTGRTRAVWGGETGRARAGLVEGRHRCRCTRGLRSLHGSPVLFAARPAQSRQAVLCFLNSISCGCLIVLGL